MIIYSKLIMILYELFYNISSFKIRKLIEVNVYTNFIIKNLEECRKILNVLINNWISTVILNSI